MAKVIKKEVNKVRALRESKENFAFGRLIQMKKQADQYKINKKKMNWVLAKMQKEATVVRDRKKSLKRFMQLPESPEMLAVRFQCKKQIHKDALEAANILLQLSSGEPMTASLSRSKSFDFNVEKDSKNIK